MRKYYKIGMFMLALVALAILMPSSVYAAAHSAASIDANISNGDRNLLYNAENGCTARLAAARANGGTNRSNVNESTPYPRLDWISTLGDRRDVSISGVAGSTANINLQYNQLMFICAILVNPDQDGDVLGPTARILRASNYPAESQPVSNRASDSYPSLDGTSTRIYGATVLSGGGSVTSSIIGKIATLSKDDQSRYWFSPPLQFQYNPGGPLTSRTVTIRLTVRAINQFNGVYQCVGSGTNVSSNNYGACPPLNVTLKFTIVATPPPIDLCNNIPGNQASIPAGRVSDGTGGCVIPPIPSPPPSTTYPTFQVNGGDVVAGASFATDSPAPPLPGGAVDCSLAAHNPKAGIVSWNKKAPGYAGSGAGLAAFGNGFIQEFITSRATNPPLALSFANVNYGSSVNPSGGMYGGVFNVPHCVDYWGTRPDLATVTDFGGGALDVPSMTNGVYKHTGSNLTITDSKLQKGTHLTIYVDGNLRIANNIVYQNTNWTDTSDIQSLKIIVHGSIFIDAGVTQLDGLYVAVPDTGYATGATGLSTYAAPKRGTISTCSTGFTSYNPQIIATNNLITDCSKQLTINGSLVANQVWLLRTLTNAPDDYTTPAEVFNYGPESWLAPTTDSSYDPGYKSVVGLPPVL